MKKIISAVLTLTIVLGLTFGTTASAYNYYILEEEVAHLKNTDHAYYALHVYPENVYPEIYNYPSYVKINNLLPDFADYSASVDEVLFAQYKEYVYAQHAKVQELNQAFYKENFTDQNDKLMFSALDRGYMIILATKEEALKVNTSASVSLYYHGEDWSQIEWRVEDDGSPYFNIDSYTPEPYELVYGLHFYENREPALVSRWDDVYYMYHKLYSHYPDPSTAEEATPDYILIFGGDNTCSPAFSAGKFGDYLLQCYNIYYPYIFGYHIITTSDMKVHTLTEAYNAKIENIMDVFTDFGLGTLIGDSNFDGKINIRDVTKIQKCLATIENFTDKEFVTGFAENGGANFSERVSDFNRDGKVNIRDATAIQKKLANIQN